MCTHLLCFFCLQKIFVSWEVVVQQTQKTTMMDEIYLKDKVKNTSLDHKRFFLFFFFLFVCILLFTTCQSNIQYFYCCFFFFKGFLFFIESQIIKFIVLYPTRVFFFIKIKLRNNKYFDRKDSWKLQFFGLLLHQIFILRVEQKIQQKDIQP